MPLVVELEECRGVRMLLLEVEVVELWLLCRVATVLADINLFDGQMVTYLFGSHSDCKLLVSPLISSACTHTGGTFHAP